MLVTTSSSSGDAASRSTALAESSACVAATYTLSAPRSFSAPTACAIVPPVSIMSSVIRQVRPSTSPTTLRISETLADGRRLSMIAKVAPSRLAKPRAIFPEPTSGATTTRFENCFCRKYSVKTGRRVEVVDGDVEEPLDLVLVEVDADQTVGTRGGDQVGDQLGPDRDPGLVLAVLPPVPRSTAPPPSRVPPRRASPRRSGAAVP